MSDHMYVSYHLGDLEENNTHEDGNKSQILHIYIYIYIIDRKA
jgi:hypothetical protein